MFKSVRLAIATALVVTALVAAPAASASPLALPAGVGLEAAWDKLTEALDQLFDRVFGAEAQATEEPQTPDSLRDEVAKSAPRSIGDTSGNPGTREGGSYMDPTGLSYD